MLGSPSAPVPHACAACCVRRQRARRSRRCWHAQHGPSQPSQTTVLAHPHPSSCRFLVCTHAYTLQPCFNRSAHTHGAAAQVTTAVLVTTSDSEDDGGRRGSGIDFSNVSLRVKVEDVATGEVKLESRFPAKWMASVASVVPQLVRAPYRTGRDCSVLHSYALRHAWLTCTGVSACAATLRGYLHA